MSRWKIVPDIELKQVSCASATHVWGITPSGEIYQFSEGKWNHIEVPTPNGNEKKCKWVSVGIDGSVWCLSEEADQNIYIRVGNGWDKPSGTLSQISVGSTEYVWGVQNDNDTFKRVSSKWVHQTNQDLKYVSVGSDGMVWGIDPDGMIKRFDGSSWTDINWKDVNGEDIVHPPIQISVGSADQVYVVSVNGVLYKYSGNDSNPWIKVSGTIYEYSDDPTNHWIANSANLTQISVGADGTVWGVNKVNDNFQVLCNYYLKDSHLRVSTPELQEVRLEQGDEALYSFTISNISSGVKLTNIEIKLVYDNFGDQITIYTKPGVDNNQHEIFDIIAELGPGDSHELTFKIEALQNAVPGTYWLGRIEANYSIVPDIQPALLPIESDIKGFIWFDVVKD